MSLLKAGADPNIRDHLGRTAFYYVVYYGTPSILRTLLAHDVDVNAVDDEGVPPIARLASKGKLAEEMAAMLLADDRLDLTVKVRGKPLEAFLKAEGASKIARMAADEVSGRDSRLNVPKAPSSHGERRPSTLRVPSCRIRHISLFDVPHVAVSLHRGGVAVGGAC